MKHQDKEIQCKECGSSFIWSGSEQDFFEDKGLINIPSRCPICRKKRDVKHDFQNEYDIECSNCHKKSKSPIAPNQPENNLCQECYLKMKEEDDRKEREETRTNEESGVVPDIGEK